MADADVIVVGAGVAGLVAACELAERGRRVLIVDQENAANIGGQAYWSFGGLFFVDSPEQRRLGIKDSHELGPPDRTGGGGGWASRTVTSWPFRTGWAPRGSTGRRTTGRGSGRMPTWISRRGRSAVGCASAGCRRSHS